MLYWVFNLKEMWKSPDARKFEGHCDRVKLRNSVFERGQCCPLMFHQKKIHQKKFRQKIFRPKKFMYKKNYLHGKVFTIYKKKSMLGGGKL